MSPLAFKIALTPILILAASLAGRRWGEGVGGWLVGLPLTSGPISFFLALDYGSGFASQAAVGALGGTTAQACFCLAYGRAAARLAWPGALGLATAAFAVGAALLQMVSLPLPLQVLCAMVALALALRFSPHVLATSAVVPLPRWDLPARMVAATLLVIALTTAAPVLGPRMSGLLGTYPLFAAVLAVFAHRIKGPAAARLVLQGLLLGLFAFAGFFVVVGVAIERAGIPAAFGGAMVCALALQGATLLMMRRRPSAQ
jgi:hypothetical protein